MRDVHLQSTDDRTTAYRLWHRTLNQNAFFYDIDGIEWRSRNGVLRPVLLVELTRADGVMNDACRAGVLERLRRSGQAERLRYVAKALDVSAVVVLFMDTLEGVWLYNLSTEVGWEYVPIDEWAKTLEGLI